MEVPDVFEDISPADKNKPGKKLQSNMVMEKQLGNNDHDVDDDVLCQYLDRLKDDEMTGIPTGVPTDHNGEQTTNGGDNKEHNKPKYLNRVL